MSSIPSFNQDGLLPHDVEATSEEILESFLVTGIGLDIPDWDVEWRRRLVQNVQIVAYRFWQAGRVDEFWIDGSFVERVSHPSDIDAYYVLPRDQLGDLRGFRKRLNALEGESVWTWSPKDRRRFPGSLEAKPPFWGKYHIEVFRHSSIECGIMGPGGKGLTFAEAFRQQRGTYKCKGIIRIKLP